MIILFAVVLGLFVYMSMSGQEISLQTTASGTVRQTDDLEVLFNPQESLYETFMIFGGHVDRKLRNSFSDYSMGALEIGEATLIQAKHPDFHLCRSPGATLAQSKIRNLTLVMENPQAAEIVEDSIELHNERLAEGGDRTCIELRGNRVEPVTVRLREDGTDISQDILPKLRNLTYYLIEGAEIRDCRTLL
jgi:hypothetical protein